MTRSSDRSALGLLAGIGVGLLQIIPVSAGLLYLILLSFGHFPEIGAKGFDLAAWNATFKEPGLWRGWMTSLASGIPASLLSLFFALGLAAKFAPSGKALTKRAKFLQTGMQAIVASPPVALAIGFAFVFSPSGWIVRWLYPLFGTAIEGDWPFPRDRWGIALLIALLLKETPFLTLAAFAALRRIDPDRQIAMASGLGYAPSCAWTKIILPDLIFRLRWPFFAVFAYALSNVDLALLLGPTTPPTLAVMIVDLSRDPDLSRKLPAAALSLFHLASVAVIGLSLLLCTKGMERFFFRRWQLKGSRELSPFLLKAGRGAISLSAIVSALTILLSFANLLLWSVTKSWHYPAFLPKAYALNYWRDLVTETTGPMATSLTLGISAGLLSLIAAAIYLQAEPWIGQRFRVLLWMAIFSPLAVPDICFLLGAEILFLKLGWREGIIPTIGGHFLFVFPYVLLVLADSWRQFDRRYDMAAAVLGASPIRRFFRIRLALLRPVLFLAFAFGVAVSFALYLPTLLLGGGEVRTLATEAIALSAGGDRRLAGTYGAAQILLPWLLIASAFFGAGMRSPHRFFRRKETA